MPFSEKPPTTRVLDAFSHISPYFTFFLFSRAANSALGLPLCDAVMSDTQVTSSTVAVCGLSSDAM